MEPRLRVRVGAGSSGRRCRRPASNPTSTRAPRPETTLALRERQGSICTDGGDSYGSKAANPKNASRSQRAGVFRDLDGSLTRRGQRAGRASKPCGRLLVRAEVGLAQRPALHLRGCSSAGCVSRAATRFPPWSAISTAFGADLWTDLLTSRKDFSLSPSSRWQTAMAAPNFL